MKAMYMVGEVNDKETNWDFCGVYSTEELAVKRCVNENNFIARVKLDEYIPIEKSQFDYSYYPLLEGKPKL